jgi:CheY-like chemotaxis protein
VPARVVLMLPLGQHRNALMQATGAVAAVSKPMKHMQLYKCLDDVLTRRIDDPTVVDPTPAPALVSIPPAVVWSPDTPQEARILVVDANIVTQQIALHQLQKLGYRAEAVTSSRAMCEALGQATYDLVLIDGHMPEMEGYVAAALCHQANASPSTPLIAMTTAASAAERDKCLAAGMADTISKPIKANEIRAVLSRWLPPVGVNAA